MINLQPFNEFWIDCVFNSSFSVLTSISKSYMDASLVNCYSYYVQNVEAPLGNKLNCIRLNNSDSKQESQIASAISTTPIEFRNKPKIKETIINLLMEGILLVGVDLYDWVPNSICWHRYHWEHYSLIKEYNAFKDVFIVLDESLQGFGMHEIPSERFEISVLKSSLPVDGFSIAYNEDIDDYAISHDEILDNANRLMSELSEIKDELWKFTEKNIEAGYMFDLFSMYAHQIANRQIANIKLINRLTELALLDSLKSIEIIKQFHDLKNGWTMIKNKFIKGNISVPRILDYKNLNTLAHNLILKEIDTWETLLTR